MLLSDRLFVFVIEVHSSFLSVVQAEFVGPLILGVQCRRRNEPVPLLITSLISLVTPVVDPETEVSAQKGSGQLLR